MNYLSVEQLSKTWMDDPVLNDLSFGLNKGDKIAIVAKNGGGKSTLLNIITGKDVGDRGQAVIRKDITFGFLSQEPVMDDEATVLDQVLNYENEVSTTLKEYQKALIAIEKSQSTHNQEQLDMLMERMTELDGWDYEERIKQVMSKLKITNFEQKVGSLSGGQKKRVALAQTLVSNPDFIILDEPTNHLDFDMIEWLEVYLSRKDITLLLVTHDRYFLDRVCNQIIEIHEGKLFHYRGNYSYFLENKLLREQIEESELQKTRQLHKKELDWVRRMPKARASKSKSRTAAFDEIDTKLKSFKRKQELNLSMRMERLGSKILEMHKVSKSFGNKVLLDNFSYVFKKGEKIGILGENGSGKSTFLNIITERLAPDKGKITVGDTVIYGYYTQDNIVIEEGKKIIDVVRDVADFITNAEGHKITAMSFLKQFGFDPKQQQKFVSTLSGGERRRLHLMRVLIQNPNFIILDEPTNDLDIDTLTTLEDFLINYGGCLIVVSHDRYFMDKIIDSLFVFKGSGEIQNFPGTYSEYRDWQDVEDESNAIESTTMRIKKEAPKAKVEAPSEKSKLSFKEKYELEQLEIRIKELNARKLEIEKEMGTLSSEFKKIAELSQELQAVKDEIDESEMRWLALEELK